MSKHEEKREHMSKNPKPLEEIIREAETGSLKSAATKILSFRNLLPESTDEFNVAMNRLEARARDILKKTDETIRPYTPDNGKQLNAVTISDETALNPFSEEIYSLLQNHGIKISDYRAATQLFLDMEPEERENISYTALFIAEEYERSLTAKVRRIGDILYNVVGEAISLYEAIAANTATLSPELDKRITTLLSEEPLNVEEIYNFMVSLYQKGYRDKIEAITKNEGRDSSLEGHIVEIRSHTALSDLGRTDTKRQKAIKAKTSLYDNPKDQEAIITTGNTQIIIPGELTDSLKIDARTDRTLKALEMRIPEGKRYGKDEVARIETVTIDELMEQFGLRDKKAARESIKQDLKLLSSLSLEIEDDKGNWTRIPVAGDTFSLNRGHINGAFSPSFIQLTRNGFTEHFDKRLMTVDMKKYQQAWPIGIKLMNHTGANLGKPNENLLSVAKLLEYVKSIPSEDEVREGSRARAYTRCIIEPLENGLNHLVDRGVLNHWDYCHSKGEPLTDEEQDARFDAKTGKEKALDYEIAKDVLITWELSEQPSRNHDLEARTKSREAKKQAKEEKEAKAKKRQERIEKAKDKKAGELAAIAEAKAQKE